MKKCIITVLMAAGILALLGNGVLGTSRVETVVKAETALAAKSDDNTSKSLKWVNKKTGEEKAEKDIEKDDETQPWREAYLDFVHELAEDVPKDAILGYEELPFCYYLYDIEKDGIPELIVKHGDCEADYYGILYKYDKSRIKELATIGMGHTSLYTCPDENGIIVYTGHMGYASMSRLTINKKSKVKFEGLLDEDINESGAEDYTYPEELIPGSMYLYECNIHCDLGVTKYDEINDQMTREIKALSAKDVVEDDLEDILSDIIKNDGEIIAVSGDGYGGGLGRVSFSEFLKKIDEFSDVPYCIDESVYVDMNDDKVEECVLKLIGGGNIPYVDWAVCSLQDGDVYVYVLNHMGEFSSLLKNGNIVSGMEDNLSSGEEWSRRVIFDHDQCTLYETMPVKGMKKIL